MTARYGLPYFQNFLNSDMQPNQVRSMLPPATGRANAQARQRPVRLGGADRLAGRGDDQLRAPGYRHRGDAAGSTASSTTCSNSPSPAWS